ncbi:AbrB family transcriptional regulator [Sphaerochaeta sp. PS]|uniref:AbrB family transcriptional regulator n=1 Tax=Sphaerochaeta sp. PS TaxID=3076336 RepID=UPI0028A50816|nr:AbrB family transcriptional regulator [Sphaerochaeta sp. PS]MDT4762820.1 AbrB family transcriptional regulator [Sphaerochaeta sp. PS]
MTLLYLILLHIAGGAGGFLLKRLRIPAGALIGSLLAAMLFNTLYSVAPAYPKELRLVIQIISGMVIGTRFTQSDIKMLKTMVKPVIILVIMLLAINMAFAYLMEMCTSLSFMTSFFACAPGGVSDLALVATDFGATMEHVALLQLFRLISVIIIFPPMIRKILPHTDVQIQPKGAVKSTKPSSLKGYLLSLATAFAGGGAFLLLQIPAGAILGSIFAIALLNIVTDKAAYPKPIKPWVQIFAGCYIGSKVTFQTIMEGKILLLPALILMVELFVMAFLTAFVLHKVCRLNWGTALFSATPGGIAEMGLISDELGLETPKIVLMHTFRILAVLGVLPLIAQFLG